MSKKSNVTKPRTEEQQMLCLLRKKMNVVTETELQKKKYVCTFDKKTHKLSSIKPSEKENMKKEIEDAVAEKIKKELFEKCHIKISLTASHSVRSCILLNTLPKPSKKKSKSKTTKKTNKNTKKAA